ncbi:MAG TPA: cache domain-containing protein, partial [Polyangiaceae bacterium]|nr:cache domain-containing protein [Polyangiaceae bacterium]
MRLKIIALFSFIVLAVGLAGWALSVSAATSLTQADPNDAPRALGAAVAQLEVEGLVTERWLSLRAADPAMREPFLAGTPNAKSEAATAFANKINDASANAPELVGVRPSLVALVDANGIVLGRNGSTLMRGQDLAKAYPTLKTAIDTGTTSSDVWVNRERNEQLLASYAPVRGEDGKVLGAVVFGTSLNDERLTAASDKTSGQAILLAVKGDKGLDIVAKSANAEGAVVDALGKPPASDAALQVLATGKSLDISGMPSGAAGIARMLDGYGDGKRAVVVAVVKPPQKSLASALLFPAIGAV